MKKLLALVLSLMILFTLAMPSSAGSITIDVSNNIIAFDASEFSAIDGWYTGVIDVGWNGNANNSTDLTWSGNEGEVIVTPYIVSNNKQESGTIAIMIEQTDSVQYVVFSIEKINGKILEYTVIVPPSVVSFDVLRTANNPGYYFSGMIIDFGVDIAAGAVNKDTFSAIARVRESNGNYQGSFGSFAWDPNMSNRALPNNWAQWNILDAYVVDADGNRVDSGQYVKIDIEWETRTVLNAAGNNAERYDVPATRAGWFYTGFRFATVEVVLEQNEMIANIGYIDYSQDETLHDPLFVKFNPEVISSFGTTSAVTFVKSLYKPEGANAASEENKKPLIIWFQGADSQYVAAANNEGSALVFNNLLKLADSGFQDTIGGAYILVPQASGSVNYANNENYLTAVERIIKDVIDDPENFIDTDRIILGGNSMGGNMVGYLVSSAYSTIDYAAAIFCSGPATAGLSATQAQAAVARNIAFYSLRNSTDSQGGSGQGTTTYNNLRNAGANIVQSLYSERYTFDGAHYYGAHDSWNYFYNNLANIVVDGETLYIYDWIAQQHLN